MSAVIYLIAEVLIVFNIGDLVIARDEDGSWDGANVEGNGVALGVAVVVAGEAEVLHELTHVSDVFQACAAFCLLQVWYSFGIPSAGIDAGAGIHFFGAVVIQICPASVRVGKAYVNMVLGNVLNELIWFVAVFASNFNKV